MRQGFNASECTALVLIRQVFYGAEGVVFIKGFFEFEADFDGCVCSEAIAIIELLLEMCGWRTRR